MKKQKGITLIALIITIIVMLVLVGVTVTMALNGGLFETARKATNGTQIEANKEALLSAAIGAIGTDGKVVFTGADGLDANLPEGFSGSNGTYTKGGYTFTVNKNTGEITVTKINSGGGTTPTISEDLEKYIMGADKTGRPVTDIMDMDNFVFIDDATTEGVDEIQTLGVEVLESGQNEDSTKGFIYAKYDNKAYKVTVDITTFKTEKLEIIYEPKGREGQDLGTVTGDSKYNGWTILYDNGDTVEAIAPFVSDGTLALGSANNTDEAVRLYNNAITLINDYVKAEKTTYNNGKKITEYTQDGTTNGVRSVGAAVDPTDEDDTYSSTNLEKWNSKYNGEGKRGDMAYEQDIVRMVFHGKNASGARYLVASRHVYAVSDEVQFRVYMVEYDGSLGYYISWYGYDDGWFNSAGTSNSVRPIISINIL